MERATKEEYEAWNEKDGFYTAPEFLEEKFRLKTGKLLPKEIEEALYELLSQAE
jgi:hypothetical protein